MKILSTLGRIIFCGDSRKVLLSLYNRELTSKRMETIEPSPRPSRPFYVYLALMAVYGNALTMVQTASTTLLQESSTPEMAGRIFGLYGAAYSSFLPIGMVVFGLLADRTSMRLLMVVSGGLLILMAAVMFVDKSFYRHGSES